MRPFERRHLRPQVSLLPRLSLCPLRLVVSLSGCRHRGKSCGREHRRRQALRPGALCQSLRVQEGCPVRTSGLLLSCVEGTLSSRALSRRWRATLNVCAQCGQ